MTPADHLVQLSRRLSADYAKISYADPVAYVYNPLDYAAEPHENYLRRWGGGPKRVIFAGMNPGPYGMAQVGVPFGEIRLVRDWLEVSGVVKRPPLEHPKKPVLGFDCTRSEVSGRRLWGLFVERFKSPQAFFAGHFVVNLCPLMFLDASGRNLTPDKLPRSQKDPTMELCRDYIAAVAGILEAQWVVAVGAFSAAVCSEGLADKGSSAPTVVRIQHPSPANPHANRDWAGSATADLEKAGIW